MHKAISINKQTGRNGQVSPRKQNPRAPGPQALHQNDGNPILLAMRTEVQFYKLRDLCQYFTRIADASHRYMYHYMDKMISFSRRAKLYQFILPYNVTHVS